MVLNLREFPTRFRRICRSRDSSPTSRSGRAGSRSKLEMQAGGTGQFFLEQFGVLW
jgi:hypothetical protein